jgi:uncharacterized paraquat-inducible protein A
MNVYCQKCGQAMEIPIDSGGEGFSCPSCGAEFVPSVELRLNAVKRCGQCIECDGPMSKSAAFCPRCGARGALMEAVFRIMLYATFFSILAGIIGWIIIEILRQ